MIADFDDSGPAMTIKFLCPYGHKLAVPDDRAGKKGRCPVCNQRVYIPKPDTAELNPTVPPVPPAGATPPPADSAGTPLDVDAVDDADAELDSPEVVVERDEQAITPTTESEIPIGRVLGWDLEPAQLPENRPLEAPQPTEPPPPPKPIEEESLPFGSISLPPPAPDSGTENASAVPPAVEEPVDEVEEAVDVGSAAAASPPAPPAPPTSSLLTGELPPEPAEELPAAVVTPDEPLEGYQPDRGKLQTVHLLAVALGALTIFAAAPALKHLNLVEAPGWARVLLVMSALQLLYVAWMVSLPDWSTVWIGMVVFAVAAAIYGMGWAIVAFTPHDKTIDILGLEDVRRGASGWCLAMLLLTTLMTYCCGRISAKWRKAWELAKAQAEEKRLPSGA